MRGINVFGDFFNSISSSINWLNFEFKNLFYQLSGYKIANIYNIMEIFNYLRKEMRIW